MKRILVSIFLLGSLVHCARQKESISQSTQFTNAYLINLIRANDPNSLDKIVFSRADVEGTTLTRINSTNQDFYIYFSMQTNSQIPASQASSTSWDIAFNRYKIATNGGGTNSSGRGAVCLSSLTSVSVAASTARAAQNCSDDKFVSDTRTSTQGIGGAVGEFVGNSILTDWFSYQIGNLTTKGLVYIVRSGTGNQYFAVRMESYYSDAGTSGYPTIRWKRLSE
ncbi:HmuY protein [Leptospira ryugenii]|uniref:HmuY protein n=1 Tax=Leptospira ryugenii TaxID=1917863 RepID=A0A2P2E3A9_9LEPT|nr:HmuY family protein [Leptospira ryugenii]GBF51382.1 HmuY protein [Leptospira ryugenii]